MKTGKEVLLRLLVACAKYVDDKRQLSLDKVLSVRHGPIEKLTTQCGTIDRTSAVGAEECGDG